MPSEFTSHRVKVNGLELHYLEWGSAASPPLLLLHGSAGHAHVWDLLAARLCQRYRIIALDQRGHGDSRWAAPAAYSARDYVADLKAFTEALNLDRLILIGHSMGALHSMIYAGSTPGRVDQLVIIDIEANPPLWQKEFLNKAGQKPHQPFASLEEAAQDEARRSPNASPEVLLQLAAYSTKRLADGKLIYKFDRATLREFDSYDARPYLSLIACPTLIIRGALSEVMSAEAARLMQQVIPDCRLIEIEDAGHTVFLDQPVRFEESVTAFLSSGEGSIF